MRTRANSAVLAVVVLACAVAAWEAAARHGENVFFPPPSAIAVWARDNWATGPPSHLYLGDRFLADTSASLSRTLVAWVGASLAGAVLGLLLGRSRLAFDLANPVLQYARATPPVIVIPVLFFLFGVGTPLQIALIVLGTVWPVLLNTVSGVRAIHPELLDTADVLRIGRFQRVMRLLVPAAAPAVLTGLRISLGIALVLMVVSELYAATDGIGHALLDAQRGFDMTGMWASIVLLAVIGNVLNGALTSVERVVLARHGPQEH